MHDLPSFDRPMLFTDRLVLRRPHANDAAAIVAIVGDRDVARRLARVPHPYGPADAAFFLDHVAPGEWVWAITLRGDDRLIGVVGLTPGADTDTAELGYWLSPACWGKGIVTEAARAVVAHGFTTLGLGGLTSGHFADNPASGRVLEKLGFVVTGRAMRPCLAAGTTVPVTEMHLRPAERA